jgi:outer membrane autotransporter protein
MTNSLTARQKLLLGTALMGAVSFGLPSAAMAACVVDGSGVIVSCDTVGTGGYNGAATNGLTINVLPNASVTGAGLATAAPLLSTGSAGVVTNAGTINIAGGPAGTTAIAVGGGSTVTNAATATGAITGDILFGTATTGQTNTLNNLGPATGITGNIGSAGGAFVASNSGTITGNLNSAGNTTLINSGTLAGNVALGAGNDIVTNTGTLTGNVNLGTGTNVFNAVSGTSLPTGTLTADAAGLNTLNLAAGGGTIGAVTNFDVLNVNGTSGVVWNVAAPIALADRINLNSGLLQVSNAAFLGANTIVNAAGPAATGGLVFTNAASGTYSGAISGAGVVVVGLNGGAGVTGFTGANSYTGGTTVASGTLEGNSTSLQGAIAVAAPATLLFTQPTNGSFAGALSGAGTLTKAGAGTLTLTNVANNSTIGRVGVNAGTLALNGALTASNGTMVTSGATLNVAPGGALVSAVTGNAGSFTTVDGTITGNVGNAGSLSGAGTIVGNVTNTGILAPGNGPGTFNVNGVFTQTAAGTIAVQLSPSTVAGTGYDRIIVTGTPGTATLAGTAVLGASTGLYVGGSTYDIVTATGGVTGSLALSGNVISPFISFANTGIVNITGGQAYRLTLVRTNYAVGIGAGATPNQIATANGFQGLVTGATGDAATVVIAVDNMTAAQAQGFFTQTSPEPYSAYATGLLDKGELFTRQIQLQLHGTPSHVDGASIWGRGYGSWANGNNRDSFFGTDQRIFGGAGGIDYRSNGLTLGIAGGYSHDRFDYGAGTSRGRGNSWQVGGYFDYDFGGFDVDATVAYVHGSYRNTRTINITSISRIADANFNGNLFKAIGTVGYNFDIGGMKLRPFAGIDYSTGHINGFSETGAGALNLTVDRINTKRTDALVGISLSSSPNPGLSPYGRVAYRYDLNRRNNDVSAAFNGNTASRFTVGGTGYNRSAVDVDAGLNYNVSQTVAFFAVYEGSFRKRGSDHGFSAGLRVSFGRPAAVAVVPPPAPVTAPPAPVAAQLPPCPPAAVTPGPFLVFFNWDQSMITAEAAAILDRAAEQFVATGQTTVQLAGHADKSGKDDYNIGLSQRRADAVKAYLSSKGVPGSATATEAFGESRPLVDTANGVREPQNRRVEITFSGAPVATTGPCTPQ